MHARLEDSAVTPERLQSASYGSVLLEHRHMIALLCQQGSGKEASEASAYDDYAFPVHSFALIISLKICSDVSSSEQVTTVPTSTPSMPWELMFCPVSSRLGIFVR